MSEKTKNGDNRAGDCVPSWIWILLFVLGIGAYFAGLGMPLVGPDEPRYAQVAREMFERRDLITPTLGGYHWFEKPALLYWLQIGAYHLLGVTEFAARLGPALCGLGTSVSLWFLGRSTDENGANLGKWLALISSSTLGIIVFSHGASFDIIVTFPLTAALVSYFIFYGSDGRQLGSSILPLLLFYVFVGLALLAKGLIGIVFPFAIVAFFHLISWKMPGRRLLLSIPWGVLITLAIAATWYLPMYMRHDYEFINEFFLQHHFQRFTSNKYQHPQPFYFFFWVLPLMTIPWLPFFGGAVVNRIKSVIKERGTEGPGLSADLIRFAWAWLLVPLVFFSLSGSKLPGYILPAVPAAAVISGIYVRRWIQNMPQWRNIALGIAALTFATIIVLALTAAPRFANEESVKSLIEAADARGHSSKPVLMFLRVSHSVEFYAAGRLVRDSEGKLYRITSRDDLVRELRTVGGTAVVLVPSEYVSQLSDTSNLKTELLGNNEEFSVALVTAGPLDR
jgi:4-amino-4-deoxy-L-arabinose transferase-like glycosyltransferase